MKSLPLSTSFSSPAAKTGRRGKKRILVTGGAGFIGSHLCRSLINKNDTVLCVDDLSTGNTRNIQDLRATGRLQFLQHDVTRPLRVGGKVHEIYHLACPASPPAYQRDPLKTIDTCVLGTRHLLELAMQKKAKFLFASTSEVYGDPLQHPQKESYWGNVNPVGIRSCYDEGKRLAETLCMEYQRRKSVEIRLARIFNTYGPNMDPKDGRVVSSFIVQALRSLPLTIYGTGRQTRSFQYVDDLISGMLRMMQNTKNFAGPVNLGNPKEFTIHALAKKILTLLPDSTSRLVFRPLPADDPKQRRPDITLARTMLGWKPTVSLNAGLQKTILYFRERLEHA